MFGRKDEQTAEPVVQVSTVGTVGRVGLLQLCTEVSLSFVVTTSFPPSVLCDAAIIVHQSAVPTSANSCELNRQTEAGCLAVWADKTQCSIRPMVLIAKLISIKK